MALLVGQLQAVITADRSQHARELRAAEADDKAFKSRTGKDKAKIDGDEKPFTESTKRAIQSAGVMRAKVGNFIGEIRGELLTVGAVGGILMGFKSVVMAASNLEESANAIQVTFGQAASKVFDFTSTAARSIGQSNVEAREAAATFGVYGKQAGLAQQQNAAFSVSLVKLASDMASFRNTSPQEAVDALGAALRGESDPIEAYGVLLTEAVLQQRALKMGVIETTSQALTPQQRVLVAYQEILAQTKDAQGDFGRTQDGLANQLRILRATVIDQAAALGKDLLPAAKNVVTALNSAVGPAFAFVGGVVKEVIGTVGDLADAWNDLPGPVQAAVAALLVWRVMQDRVTEGVSSLGERISAPWKQFGDEVRLQTALAAMEGEENLSRLGASIATLEARGSTIGQMATSYREAAAGASEWLTNQNALTAGSNAFTGTLRGMAPAFDGIVSRAAGAAAAIGTGLRGAVSSLVEFLGGPWSVAIAAGTLILGQWVAKQQQAAAAAEQHRSKVKTLTQEILENEGAVSKQTKAQQIQEAQSKGLYDWAQKLGVSQKTMTEAILGNEGAIKRVQAALKEWMSENPDMDLDQMQALQDTYGAFVDLAGGMVQAKDAAAGAKPKLAEVGITTSDLAGGATGANEALSPMAEAIKKMGDESATAEDKISALQNALDEITKEKLSVEEATQAINEVLRGMGDAFKEAKEETSKAGVALLDASGAIDTTTEAGSALQDKLVDLSSDYNGLFSATVEAAQAQGKTLPEALGAAALATAPMRQKFLDIADAAGLNSDQIALLTEHYGMLPTQATTAITQPGMVEGILSAIGLKDNIESIPNGWQTILTSTAPEQIALMESLGFKVQTLPNGRVLVTADTAQAWTEINKITTPKTLIINLQARGFSGAALGSAIKQYGGGFARGGYMPANPIPRAVGGGTMPFLPYKVGEEGEEIVWPNRSGFVSTALQTRELLRQMSQVDRRMVPSTAMAGAMPATGGMYGGDGAAMLTGSSHVDRSITVNAAPTIPTMQQLQDLQHEQEVLYG